MFPLQVKIRPMEPQKLHCTDVPLAGEDKTQGASETVLY